MKTTRIKINNIPSIIWGEKSNKVFLAVHGNMSNKEDEVIKILANKIVSKGYQLLSFDLPEHGERKDNKEYLCKVQNCVSDLEQIIEYAKVNYDEINLWACSMGAYFSLLAYKEENIRNSLFLSPVVDMKVIIDNIMLWSNTTERELEENCELSILENGEHYFYTEEQLEYYKNWLDGIVK